MCHAIAECKRLLIAKKQFSLNLNQTLFKYYKENGYVPHSVSDNWAVSAVKCEQY